MSLPKARVSGDVASTYADDPNTSFKRTISLRSFGISIPTTDLPGITSTIRTLTTAKDLARSLAKPLILLTLIPAAG